MSVLGLQVWPIEIRSVRFLFAGGMTAGLYFGIIYMLLILDVPSWLAALIAYLLAFTVGYAVQKFFTFQSKSNHSVSLPRYAVLQGCCATIAALCAFGAERFGLTQPLMISLLSTSILGVVTYLVSSKWVFQNDKNTQ